MRTVAWCPRRGAVAAAILVVAGSILVAAGCGPSGPARYQLEGQVTFAGRPVPNGLIRFEPDGTQGNGGPVGYAAIKDGRYSTTTAGSKGALEGPIVAYLTGGPAPDPKVEFPQLWFIDYRATFTLEPKAGTTTFDVDVPASAKAAPSAAAAK